MEQPSKETQEAIDKMLNYNWDSEVKHYEEENDIELTDEHFNDPDLLKDTNHILYSMIVVQLYMNS